MPGTGPACAIGVHLAGVEPCGAVDENRSRTLYDLEEAPHLAVMAQSLHEEGACRTRSNQRAAVGTPTPTRAHNEGKRAGADPCGTGAAAHGNHLRCWSLPGRRHRAFSSSSFGVCATWPHR